MTKRYRHKVRGTTYRVLFEAAKASSIIAALDDMTMVVYQGEADGLVWVRPALEFFDGRFEPLPETAKSQKGPGPFDPSDWHYDSQGYCDNPGRGY